MTDYFPIAFQESLSKRYNDIDSLGYLNMGSFLKLTKILLTLSRNH